MKIKSIASKILTNKWVLNIVALISLLNVIGYGMIGNLNSVFAFIIIAILVRYFSKNMIIVLGVPLILVNLLVNKRKVFEGMENGSNTISKNNLSKDNNDQDKINNLVNKNNSTSIIENTTSASTTVPTKIENSEGHQEEVDGFESGKQKNRGYNIDYASTIENAYDELNNILGSEGIQRLTDDTQNLMKQQMKLAEAMKGMTPVIKQIAPMVENLKSMMGQIGDGKEGLGGIMNLAKQFAGQTKKSNQ